MGEKFNTIAIGFAITSIVLNVFFALLDIIVTESSDALDQVLTWSFVIYSITPYATIVFTILSLWKDIIGITPFSSGLKEVGRSGVTVVLVLIPLIFLGFIGPVFSFLFFLLIFVVLFLYLLYKVSRIHSATAQERRLKYLLLWTVLSPIVMLILSGTIENFIEYDTSILGNLVISLFIPSILPVSFLYFNTKFRPYLVNETEGLDIQKLLYMEPDKTSNIPSE